MNIDIQKYYNSNFLMVLQQPLLKLILNMLTYLDDRCRSRYIDRNEEL